MVVDKALDTIVKENQKARRQAKVAAKKAKLTKGKNQARGRTGKARDQAPIRGRGRGRGGGRGAGGNNRQNNNSRAVRQAAPAARGAGRGRGRGRGGRMNGTGRANVPKGGLKSASAMARSDTGLKVHVDNLDFGVTQKDMQELFQEFGKLKKVQLHYDAKGKSQGNCEIFFARKADGLRAVKKYNNVPLDGRKMKIDVVGQVAAASAPRVPKPQPKGKSPAQKKKLAQAKAKKGPVGKKSGGQSPVKAGKKKLIIKKKGGKPAEKKPQLTEEQLDKQLDAYLTKGAGII